MKEKGGFMMKKVFLIFTVTLMSLVFSGIIVNAADTAQTPVEKDGYRIVNWIDSNGGLSYRDVINTTDYKSGWFAQKVFVDTEGNETGKFGNKCDWTYDDTTNTLTITYDKSVSLWGGSAGYAMPNVRSQANVYTQWAEGVGDAFSGWKSKVENVVIKNSTTVAPAFFRDCTALKNITFPENLKEIGHNAFNKCTSLTGTIIIPSTLTKIGANAFVNSSINKIVFEASQDASRTLTINKATFCDALKLTDVILPKETKMESSSTVLQVGYGKNVTRTFNIFYPAGIDSGVITAINNAYTNTTDYPITLHPYQAPAEILSIVDGGTLYNNSTDNSQTVWYIDSNGTLVLDGVGKTANGTAATPLPYADYKDSIKKVIAMNGITHIQSKAFEKYDKIEELALSDNAEFKLGWKTFNGCIGLKSVTIPKNTSFVGANTFQDCTGLETVIFEDGLSSIGDPSYNGTFRGCTGIKEIVIPTSVEAIADNSFYGCSGLNKLTFADPENSKCKIIGQNAFYLCNGLEGNIVFPKALEKMGSLAFVISGSAAEDVKLSLKSVEFLGDFPVLVDGSSAENGRFPEDTTRTFSDVFRSRLLLGVRYAQDNATWAAKLDELKGYTNYILSTDGLFLKATLGENGAAGLYYYNKTGSPQSLVAIAAAYDTNDSLADLRMCENISTIADGEFSSNAGVRGVKNYNALQEGHRYAFYVWKDLTSLTPLINTVE